MQLETRVLRAGESAVISFHFWPGDARQHAVLRVALGGPPPATKFRVDLVQGGGALRERRSAMTARARRAAEAEATAVAWSMTRLLDVHGCDSCGGVLRLDAGPIPVVGEFELRVVLLDANDANRGTATTSTRAAPLEIRSTGPVLLSVAPGPVAVASRCRLTLRPKVQLPPPSFPPGRRLRPPRHSADPDVSVLGTAGEEVCAVLVARDAFGNRRGTGGEGPYIVIRRLEEATRNRHSRDGSRAGNQGSGAGNRGAGGEMNPNSSMVGDGVGGHGAGEGEGGCCVIDVGDGSYLVHFTRVNPGCYLLRAWVHGAYVL